MKHFLFVLLAVILNCNLLFSQSGRSIRAKAGDDLAQAYSPQGFYRFPQFTSTVLYFKTGAKASSLLFNYNIFSGKMQFVNPNGDTLDMVTTADIDSVVFAKNVFLFNEGFMEIVAATDSFKLLKKVILKIDVEDIGAYGRPNPTGSIQNIRTYSAGSAVYHLILNQDVVLNEHIYWFFSNGKTFLKANKTNLFKLLSPAKQAIAEAWLKQNKMSFEKEDDLGKLLAAISA